MHRLPHDPGRAGPDRAAPLRRRASNIAPTLTHFASRDCFAGCMFERRKTPTNTGSSSPRGSGIRRRRSPGSIMPDYDLTEDQIDSLVAYL